MGYSNSDSDDFEKLRIAVAQLSEQFGSVDAILTAMGLADLPTAQRYGIFFGFVVFVCTVSAVVGLLVMGGTLQRLKEQAESGEATAAVAPHNERSQRALLMERLLEARERMLQKYKATTARVQQGPTELMQMLANIAPTQKQGKTPANIPQQYQENYVKAYRTCQDKPGGESGRV
jgi:hypothetical protein